MFILDCSLANIMNALREEPSIQIELMQELLNLEVDLSARYTSPFREDHTPGCCLRYAKIMYRASSIRWLKVH